jgi:ABC-type sugar transport system permease subunit
MNAMTLVLAAVAILVIILAIVATRSPKREPDYRASFALGAVFLIVYFVGSLSGLYDPSSVFLILGIVFLGWGLANRAKWGKPSGPLTEREKRTRKISIVALAVLVVLGLVVVLLL